MSVVQFCAPMHNKEQLCFFATKVLWFGSYQDVDIFSLQLKQIASCRIGLVCVLLDFGFFGFVFICVTTV